MVNVQLLKTEANSPMASAPMAYQRLVHPDGELALAAAPAQHLDLQPGHLVGQLEQPPGGREKLRPEVGGQAEREHVHVVDVDQVGGQFRPHSCGSHWITRPYIRWFAELRATAHRRGGYRIC